jgi:hypothetical protein
LGDKNKFYRMNINGREIIANEGERQRYLKEASDKRKNINISNTTELNKDEYRRLKLNQIEAAGIIKDQFLNFKNEFNDIFNLDLIGKSIRSQGMEDDEAMKKRIKSLTTDINEQLVRAKETGNEEMVQSLIQLQKDVNTRMNDLYKEMSERKFSDEHKYANAHGINSPNKLLDYFLVASEKK